MRSKQRGARIRELLAQRLQSATGAATMTRLLPDLCRTADDGFRQQGEEVDMRGLCKQHDRDERALTNRIDCTVSSPGRGTLR